MDNQGRSFSEQCCQYLRENKIPYEVFNNGIQVKVMGPEGFIDFYPSTGKWTATGGTQMFGFIDLLKYCDGQIGK